MHPHPHAASQLASESPLAPPQPAILLITGASDDPAFPLQAQRLQAELRQRYRDPQRVGLTSIPGMSHAFAAEPGIEPAPQTGEASSWTRPSPTGSADTSGD
jgi:hypothetical protein